MVFDQYSRYKACSDFLRQAGFVAGDAVLDVGSGIECLFGQFMPDAAMNYVDPLVPVDSGPAHIAGDIFSSELDGRSFDCVTAVDVLEHIPPEHRVAFLERMSSLGKNALIIGFPSSDSSDALETDKAINDQYRAIFGSEYPWLEEHFKYGLPSLAGTVAQMSHLGWHCQTVGHCHTPWLSELLGYVSCAWDVLGMSSVILKASEKFNRELYAYDFRPPCYRQFVIASRTPLPPIMAPAVSDKIGTADIVFRALMEEVKRQYFAASLRQFIELNADIDNLNQRATERDAYIDNLNQRATERDAYIANLNQAAEEVSAWGKSLRVTVGERDAQIVAQQEGIVAHERALSEARAALTKIQSLIFVRFFYAFAKLRARLRARCARK